ncbi:hypothetical protein ACQ4M3_26610 [Leptolyngbya sp. AN03gr2]
MSESIAETLGMWFEGEECDLKKLVDRLNRPSNGIRGYRNKVC